MRINYSHLSQKSQFRQKGRIKAAYSSQSILEQYYGYHFPIIIEGLDGSLIFHPSLVDYELLTTIKLNNPITNANLTIYTIDGLEVFHSYLKDSKTEIRINSELWPQGLFYGIVTNNGEVILHSKGIKK